MTKLIFLFSNLIVYSQVLTINLKIENLTSNDNSIINLEDDIQYTISIQNNTNKNIIIPLDTTGFKQYLHVRSKNEISKDSDKSKDLGMKLTILDSLGNYTSFAGANSSPVSIRYSENYYSEIKFKLDSVYQSNLQRIDRQNNIIQNYKADKILSKRKTDAQILYNNYLMNNLIYLKPKEKITFYVKYEFPRFDNELTESYFALIAPDTRGSFQLFLDIDKDFILNQLTKKQLKKIKEN